VDAYIFNTPGKVVRTHVRKFAPPLAPPSACAEITSSSASRLNLAETPMKLGFLYHEGPASWLVESRTQFKMALREINEARLLPINLTYLAADTHGHSFGALQGTMALLADRDVVGIVGTGYSSVLRSAAMYCSASRTPIVSPGASAPDLTDKSTMPFLVRTVASDSVELNGLLSTVVSLGWRKIAVIASDGLARAASYFQARATASGVEVVLQVCCCRAVAAQQIETRAYHCPTHASDSPFTD
jgi:ABC-type branched-subunit amino acid transport system substrate-binding protein